MSKALGVAAKAVILKEGKILLLQRPINEGFDPGLWELPGGKLEYGEILTESLNREVREEVGLLIKIGRPFITWHFCKEPFWVTGVTFAADYLEGTVRLSHEHQDYAWIEAGDYKAYQLGTAVKEQLEAYMGLYGN